MVVCVTKSAHEDTARLMLPSSGVPREVRLLILAAAADTAFLLFTRFWAWSRHVRLTL